LLNSGQALMELVYASVTNSIKMVLLK